MSQAQENNINEDKEGEAQHNGEQENPINQYLQQVAQDQQEMKDQGEIGSQNNQPRGELQQVQEDKDNQRDANVESAEQPNQDIEMQVEENEQEKLQQYPQKNLEPEQKQIIEQKQHQQILHSAKDQQPSQQSYKNYLERQLFRMQKQINNLQQIIQNKDIQLADVKTHNESLEKNLKSLEKQKNMAERFLAMQRRNKDKIKQQYENISKKIEQYKEIGDISILKERVDELQALTSVQKYQIQLKEQQLQREKTQELASSTTTNISAFDKLSQENLQLKKKINQTIEQYKKKNDELADQILRRQQQYQEQFHLYQRTIQDLTAQLQSARQIQNEHSQRSEHHSHVQTPQPSNEHEIVNNQQEEKQCEIYKFIPNINIKYQSLMRQYLKLESEQSILKQNYHQLKEKYLNAVRDSKISSNMNISKKQYQQLLSKFNKAKQCLQKTILQNKQLRYSLANEKEIPKERVEKILMTNIDPEQQNPSQNLITNYHKVLKQRYQKLEHYISDFRNNLTNQQLIRLNQQLKERNQEFEKCNKTINQQKKEILILQEEVQFKNVFIDQLLKKNKMLQTQNQNFAEKLQKMEQNIRKYPQLEQQLNLFEKDNILLVQQISYYKTQSFRWNKIYEELKVSYENLLQEKVNLLKNVENAGLGASKGLNLQTVLQQQKKCEQCSKRSENPTVITSQYESQTDNFNDIHYKQLIQVLKTLRKFPQKTKSFLSQLETSKLPLGELKKKLEDMQQKYNQKFKELKVQKSENDQWRVKTKQQIMKQFQDIRQLVETQKLQIALRTAKFLIQELQKDDEGGQQEEDPEKAVQQQGQMKQ